MVSNYIFKTSGRWLVEDLSVPAPGRRIAQGPLIATGIISGVSTRMLR